MSIRRASALLALLAAAFLAGCAAPPQLPVNLTADFFTPAKAKPGRVGVLLAALPKPDTAFPGAGCLLCIGVANANHTQLNREVQTFSTQELNPLAAELVALLKQRGMDAVLISDTVKLADLPDLGASDPANKSRKNFAALKGKHNIERLLVVDIQAVGVWRAYSAYVPTDVPRAIFNGQASLIDLSTHALEWHLPLALSRAAEGAWDEPPKFPGLSNAYYQVLETGKDMIKKPFKP